MTNGFPFDFKYNVILIYRLKASDRAGFIKVTFGFHQKCGGSSGFSLLKKCFFILLKGVTQGRKWVDVPIC